MRFNQASLTRGPSASVPGLGLPPEQPSDDGAEESLRGERRPLSRAVGTGEFYAARDHWTSASAIRSHDRRRLRSSARAAAARRLAGIAVSGKGRTREALRVMPPPRHMD